MMHNIVKGIFLYEVLVYVVCYSLCPSGQYWDWITGACSWCSDICLEAESRNSAEECKQKCPNWTQRTEASEEKISTSVTPKVGTNITTRGNIDMQTNATNEVLPIYGIVLIVAAVVLLVALGIGFIVYKCCYHKRGMKKCKCGKYLKKYCKVCRTLTQTGSERNEDHDQAESKFMMEEETPKEQGKQSPRFAHPQQDGKNDPTLPSGCSMTIKSIEDISSPECTERKECM